MKKNIKFSEKSKYFDFIISGIIGLIFGVASIIIFAVIINLTGKGLQFSTLFATISVAVACLATSFFMSFKTEIKGIIIGISVGIGYSVIVLLISLITDKGALTYNTLFHFVIWCLASLIGGVLGANKRISHKYK